MEKMEKQFRKFVIVWAICVIMFVAGLSILGYYAITEINDKGLKTVITNIWEGNNK